MNSGVTTSSSLKRAPQTTRFSAVGSCQARDSIPSRTGEPLQPLLTTLRSRLTFSRLQDTCQYMTSPLNTSQQLQPQPRRDERNRRDSRHKLQVLPQRTFLIQEAQQSIEGIFAEQIGEDALG